MMIGFFYAFRSFAQPDQFATQLDQQLGDFEFPDEFVLDVYELLHK